jgi:hypothetical protein
MKLKLFLTFDHELPLGGVRSNWNDALFEPTNTLLDVAEKLGVPVVFFTDVLCAMRFQEWDNEGYFKPYISQLRNAVSRNHDVQLHLHPHWLTSGYKENRFIPSNDFSLSDFAGNTSGNTIEGIIKSGVDFLKDVMKPVADNYRCIAFRAGGYNLGINEDRGRILTVLYENGIRYDTSIIKGFYFKSAISEVDFRKMPDPPNWYIDLSGKLSEVSESGIFEIPIASIPKTPFEVPTMFKMKKYAHRAPANRGYQIHEGKPGGYSHKIKQLFSSRMLSFDNYTLSHDYLMKILNYNVNKYRKYDEVLLSISGHPKSMGSYSFELMQRFVENVRRKYPDTEFMTFSDMSYINDGK